MQLLRRSGSRLRYASRALSSAYSPFDALHRLQVLNIEPDRHVYLCGSQNNAPWGLRRISRRGKLSASNKEYKWSDDESGDGVWVYVIDTGVRADHTVGLSRLTL